MRLDLFVKLKYQTNSKILSISIKYSVRDLLLDDRNYACPQTRYASNVQKIMSALPLASARLSKLWIPFLNDIFDRDLCKICFISIFFFMWFQSWFYHIHWFYPYRSWKRSKS